MESALARRTLLAAGGAGLALALAACTTSDALSDQVNAGDNKGWIAGDGAVSEYGAAGRKDPVSFTGTAFDGSTVDSNDFAGQVAVLNFWFASCPPCRAEAPDLQALHEELQPEGVEFLGVNVRDEIATEQAFERQFGLSYPSIRDRDGGVVMAFGNVVSPSSVPATLVLDKQGRVAAKILGTVDKGTLKALVATVLAEA